MKIKILVLIVCIFFIVLIQSTILDYIKVYNVKPNLMLIFVICIALLRGNVEGAVSGFLSGLFLDSICGKLLGLYSLLGLYLGLIIGSVNKRIYRENFLVIIFFTFISTIVYEWVVYFFSVSSKTQAEMLFSLTNIILPEAVYNSIVSILVYVLVIKLNIKLEGLNKSSRKY